MSQDALAELTDDPTEEVPRLSTIEHVNHQEVVEENAPPKREPNFYTISRDKWAVVETAHDAKDKVNRMISSIPGTEHVKAGVTTITNNHRSEKAISVTRTVKDSPDSGKIAPEISEQELRDRLPASMSGTAGSDGNKATIEDIPVIVETETMIGQGAYDRKYRPVPGGAQLDDSLADGDWIGTSGTPAYNKEASKYDLVTAGHVVEYVEDIHQPNPGNKIGTRRDGKYDSQRDENWDPGFDAGVINLGPDKKYQLADDSGGYRDRHIVGVMGRDEIKDREGSSWFELEKQGNKTGLKSGSIKKVYDVSFETGADNAMGDSGGPHYKETWDSNLGFWRVNVAGIHYAGTGKRSRATMMQEIENRYSMEI
jgi:hypothetical protein